MVPEETNGAPEEETSMPFHSNSKEVEADLRHAEQYDRTHTDDDRVIRKLEQLSLISSSSTTNSVNINTKNNNDDQSLSLPPSSKSKQSENQYTKDSFVPWLSELQGKEGNFIQQTNKTDE